MAYANHRGADFTTAIGEAIGMAAAINYIQALGLGAIHQWEQRLTARLWQGLSRIDGVRLLGPSPEQQPDRGALAAFVVAFVCLAAACMSVSMLFVVVDTDTST